MPLRTIFCLSADIEERVQLILEVFERGSNILTGFVGKKPKVSVIQISDPDSGFGKQML
jgi:hypothetical protein